MTDSDSDPKRPEIIPPEPAGSGGDIYALIQNYTDRPDLLIEAIEKHDPGFIKRMNERAQSGADQLREDRFKFARRQANVSLFVQVSAALGILVITGLEVLSDETSWLTVGMLAAFFAISQGGASGFRAIGRALADRIRKGFGE